MNMHNAFTNLVTLSCAFVVALAIASPLIAKDSEKPNKADGKTGAASDTTASDQPSLDDLLKLNDGKKPAPKNPDNKNADKTDLKPKAEMTEQQAADAFAKAVQKMDEAASRLRKLNDPGVQTQRIQEAVLRHLDEVLAHAQQQQQQGQQGQPKNQKEAGIRQQPESAEARLQAPGVTRRAGNSRATMPARASSHRARQTIRMRSRAVSKRLVLSGVTCHCVCAMNWTRAWVKSSARSTRS